jgi:hypothetical protein
MAKVPSKNNNFVGLEKVCHTFSRLSFGRDTRHASPNLDRERSAKIVTQRIWQSTIRHKYRHSPYLTKPQRSNPHPQPPLFSKKFSNIYLFPDLTIFVLMILFPMRFDRTFLEIRLTLRPEIRSDSKVTAH